MDAVKWTSAQEHEYVFHSKNKLRRDDEKWQIANERLFGGLGIPMDIEGKTILDLGCGSRLRTAMFIPRNRVVGIEPLAERFRDLEFSDLARIESHAKPAEELVESLEGQVDLLVCLNVLDHCIDERRVLHNIACYLAPGGLAYIWTDLGHTDHIHESNLSAEDIRSALESEGLVVSRMTVGVDPERFIYTDKPDYKRCGQSCAPGVMCAVFKAKKPV